MVKPTLLLFCFVGALTAVSCLSPADVLSPFVTFPYAANPCTCSLLSCTCCTGIKVAQVNFSKTLCVLISVKILSLAFDVTVKLDSKTITNFSFSATSPPTYCVPLALPIKLSMCLKIHDVKLLDFSSVQACMTLYGAYGMNKTVMLPLNCVRLSSGALTYVKTSSTSTTTTTTGKPTTTTTTTTTAKTTTTTTTPKTTTTTTTAKPAKG